MLLILTEILEHRLLKMSEGRKIDNLKELQEYVDQRHPEAKTKDYRPKLEAPRNRHEARCFQQYEYYRSVEEDIKRKKLEFRESSAISKTTDRQVRDELEQMSKKNDRIRQENKLKADRSYNLISRCQAARAVDSNQRQQQ